MTLYQTDDEARANAQLMVDCGLAECWNEAIT